MKDDHLRMSRHARLDLNALAQRVFVTDHRRQAAEELASRWTQLSPEEILKSPYVLIGTLDKLIEDLHARRERWGISYYVIFEPYLDAFAPVVARLAGGQIRHLSNIISRARSRPCRNGRGPRNADRPP